MGNITLNKPSGGQLTIAPEDGTSNETVSIPSVGVGKVLQVVEGTYGAGNTIESSSFTSSNLAVDFQAKEVGSRIIVDLQFPVWWSPVSTVNYGIFAVYEDGVTNKTASLGSWDGWLIRKPYYYSGYNNQENFSFSFTSTDTSSHNYRVYARINTTGMSMAFCDTATQGMIRITEVAA